MNLALHVGDRPADVLRNRQRLQAVIGARPVFLEQLHGADCTSIDRDSPHGLHADASGTWQAQIACTIIVADCLPVLLCDVRGRWVGAAHVGWRGLAGGVLAAAVHGFTNSGIRPAGAAADLLAWLGPCIGPRTFEVGADVRRAIGGAAPAAAALFVSSSPGKWLADLAGLARLQLQALGVSATFGNDGSALWCTVRNPLRFFSHRRDGVGAGGTGRFAACVWRVG